MVIASFDTIVGFDGSTFVPFTRYVLTDSSFDIIAKNVTKNGGRVMSCTHFNGYQRTTRGECPGRNVALYRHTAYGDQLIMTGLTAYLKHVWGNDARLFYFCANDVLDVWRWNPQVEPCGGAMPFEFVEKMHDHIFLEGMFEGDSEPDQRNCYDSMFRVAGFDPDIVPDDFKRPHLFWNQKEEKMVRQLRGKYGDYIVYHWGSSNPNRMYPREQSIATLQLLQQYIDKHTLIVMGTEEPEHFEPLPLEGVIDMRNKTRAFREVMIYVKGARVVIGPDSSLMHVAEGCGVPCVSLWGLFHPDDRVKYYKHATVIRGTSCPHSPCRNHDFVLPANSCRDASNAVEPPEFCNALRSIAPLQIAKTTYQIINAQTQRNCTDDGSPVPAAPTRSLNQEAGQTEVLHHRGTEVGKDDVL